MPGHHPVGSAAREASDTSASPDAGEWAHGTALITEITESLGPTFSTNAAKLRSLLGRFASGRFHLAVLGQFKRGKSSLLNALLGEALLPSGVAPVTAIPTMITAAPTYRVSVRYAGGGREEFCPASAAEACSTLRPFISESENPGNRRGVLNVEVGSPSPLLARGVVLIDTPGIGSSSGTIPSRR